MPMRTTVGYFNGPADRNPERYIESRPKEEPKPSADARKVGHSKNLADIRRPFNVVERRIIEKSKEGVHDLECQECKNDGVAECRGGCALSAKINRFWDTVQNPEQYNRLAEFAAHSFLK
jgi:hypothetical protein